MKTVKIISFVILSIFVLSACKSAKDKTIEKISILEKELISSTTKIDSVKAQQLIDLYINYADQFKNDSITPVFFIQSC